MKKKTILKALKVKNSKFTYHSRANKNLIKLAVSWKGLLQLGSRPHRVHNPLGSGNERYSVFDNRPKPIVWPLKK